MDRLASQGNISTPMITGGTPRDKILGLIKDEIADLDITTGDKTVHNLAKEFAISLGKSYTIESKKMDDGHTSVYVGNLKVDFSSNFEVPHIEQLLRKIGIKNPTDMQKEMFSRDFTCNTLLMTTDLKTIKDPTKRGFADIKKKILKTCLDPNITLRSNPNRIIRIIYMASKLGFDVDPNIIKWVLNNKEFIHQSSEGYLTKNLDKALSKDPDRAVHLISKMSLWNVLPITDNLYPYYANKSKTTKKIANFSGYDEFVNDTIASMKSKFPSVRLQSFNEFKLFLDKLVPKLVHKYLILSGTMKNCSGISPDFSEMAAQAGFPVLTMMEPRHQLNLVLTSDGPYAVDLSYIQFTCKHEAYDEDDKKEVIENYKSLYNDPFKALKIKQLPKQYFTNVRLPHGVYDNLRPDPYKSINKYDIKETEKYFPERFDHLKTAQLRRNLDYGEGLYMNLDKYKSVSDFRSKRRKKRMKIIKKLKDMRLK